MEGIRGLLQSSDQSGRLDLCPLIYVLALEPLLRRLRDERVCPALHVISLTGYEEGGQKVQEGTKVNFDKKKGLWLGAWRGGIPLLGPFPWSDGPIHNLTVWFRSGLQVE